MEPPPAYEPSPVHPAVIVVHQKRYTCCFGAMNVKTGSFIIAIFCLFAALEIPAVIVKVQNDEGNAVTVVLKLHSVSLAVCAFFLFCGLGSEDACCCYAFVVMVGITGTSVVISFISLAQTYVNSSALLYGHAFFFGAITVWCISVILDLIAYYESRKESNQ